MSLALFLTCMEQIEMTQTFSRLNRRLFYYFLLRKKSLIFVVRMYYRPGPLVHLYYCNNSIKLRPIAQRRPYNLRVPKENKMAGRIRQLMWESNRRSSEPADWNIVWFVILPLVIVTKGHFLLVLAPGVILVFIYMLLFSS